MAARGRIAVKEVPGADVRVKLRALHQKRDTPAPNWSFAAPSGHGLVTTWRPVGSATLLD